MTRGDRKYNGYGRAFEESTKDIVKTEGRVTGHQYIESLDASVLFVMPGNIYLFDHKTKKYTFVASDKEFECNWGFQGCEWIDPVVKTDQPCNETKVYWSSGCDYYVVNLAEMLNEKRKTALKNAIANPETGACGYSCDHFRLMKCVCQPTLTATVFTMQIYTIGEMVVCIVIWVCCIS